MTAPVPSASCEGGLARMRQLDEADPGAEGGGEHALHEDAQARVDSPLLRPVYLEKHGERGNKTLFDAV